ncbi:Hypothetical protein NTJ_09167 [Nesidiocoris tenuis]|uniref:Uncharacterized protein n=1 Tax=Nesidiocoris tenuis TaxID=355587 RepID=A0ABN7AVX8_9HEMI|nr:Hypothetical protein NTJ_09167 [Nesidiocoris tenuis]
MAAKGSYGTFIPHLRPNKFDKTDIVGGSGENGKLERRAAKRRKLRYKARGDYRHSAYHCHLRENLALYGWLTDWVINQVARLGDS